MAYVPRKTPNKLFSRKRELEIIQRSIEGYTPFEVIKWVMKEYGLTRHTSVIYYYRARKKLKEFEIEGAEEVINIHLIRYEKLYKELTDLNWHALAMKALKAKEKLLQIGSKKQQKLIVSKTHDELNPQKQFKPKEKLSKKNYALYLELISMVKEEGNE